MIAPKTALPVETAPVSDEEVVARVLAGETPLFEILMRRYNQRLYRVSRSILRDDAEAQDVMQEAYVRAFIHLDQFDGRAKFSTWLTRIAIHEALARLRYRSRMTDIDDHTETVESVQELMADRRGPEQEVLTRSLGVVLEAAINNLPEIYRSVFMLRSVEEMSTAETAECLSLSEEAVKVRLHRARALLRRELMTRAGAATSAAFEFKGVRCDRMVAAVLERIATL